MLRRVTWRFWAVLGLIIAVWMACGWRWAGNGTVDERLYQVGLTAEFFIPVVFVFVYTFVLRKPWWNNNVGTNLVLFALSAMPSAGPLAYVFLFNHGMLTSSLLAWVAIGGPLAASLLLGWRCLIWLQIAHAAPEVHAPDPRDARIAELEAEVARLRALPGQ